MPDRPQDRDATLISEAADWLAYLREGSLDIDGRRQFVRWLKQSPAHVAEMLRLSSIDCLLRSTDLEGIVPDRSSADQQQDVSNVIPWVFRQANSAEGSSSEPVRQPVRPSHWKVVSSAAALSVSLLLATVALCVEWVRSAVLR